MNATSQETLQSHRIEKLLNYYGIYVRVKVIYLIKIVDWNFKERRVI